jgi:hypothetical protein
MFGSFLPPSPDPFPHEVLNRGLYLRGQIQDRFPFIGLAPFSDLNWPRDSLVFERNLQLKRNLQLRGCPRVVLDRDKEGFSMGQ